MVVSVVVGLWYMLIESLYLSLVMSRSKKLMVLSSSSVALKWI